MGLYTRQQLMLLLLLLGAAVTGLGVVHWRAAHPELVERLEHIDREIAATEEAGGEDRGATPPPDTRAPRSRRHDEPARPRASKRQSAPSEEVGPPLDLNRATPAELMRLPGIGPVLARRIVDARDSVGRFGAVDDLAAIRGLGRVKLERLRTFVGVRE